MTQFSLPKSPKQVSWPSLRVIWYRSQNWARNPTVTIGIILSVFAAYLILAPVIMMLMDAFTVDFADQARASKLEGELTSYYLNRAMNSPIAKYIFWLPLMNTLFVSIVVIIATLLVGGLLGWLVSRTDLLGKRWFSTALIVPYMVPSWTFALAWMAIFKNRTMG
jgi:iron(III) transport system permease protein